MSEINKSASEKRRFFVVFAEIYEGTNVALKISAPGDDNKFRGKTALKQRVW